MPGFFDEAYQQDFYRQVDKGDKELRLGRLYRTHTYYPHLKLEFWRPLDVESGSTSATTFRIAPAGEDRFKHTPLSSPSLKANEEFIVVRAKCRPVVMLIPPVEIPEKRVHGGSPVNRNHALVAQVYSIEDLRDGRAKFDKAFIDNVRQLRYPEIMFMPNKAGALQTDSLLRLDECQSVFANNLEVTDWELCDDVKALLRSQFLHKIVGFDDGIFMGLREYFEN